MYDLAERLKVHRLMAVGLMESLWHMAAKNAPHGDIGRYSDTAIAELSGWPKSGKVLIEALVSSGWLDRHDTHRLVIHDWPEHCENAVHSLLAKRGEQFFDGSLPFDRKSQKSSPTFNGKNTPTREAKAEAKAKEVLNTSQVENPSSRADAKPAEPETPTKPSVDSPGMRWTETPEERTANDARLIWAEEIYFRHPKQVNKHASILALCRLYDVPEDWALFVYHYSVWIGYWQREGAKFTPPLVKSDGSGFLPDGAWRKPPPRAPAPKPARGSAFLAAIEESERQVGN